MATLSWTTSDGRREVSLKDRMRVGRASDNDIQLFDGTVSSFHARFVNRDDAWYIEDMGSTNGSFVNGLRHSRRRLRDGDRITLGDVSLTFQAEPHEKAASAPTPPRRDLLARIHDDTDEIESILDDKPGASTVSSVISMVAPPAESLLGEDPATLARRLKASYEISQATAATLDLPSVLDSVLSALFAILEPAERAFILLVDQDSGKVSTAAVKHRASAGDRVNDTISRTAIRQAMERREAILCLDAMADGRYSQAQSIIDVGIRSLMIAPLIFRDQVLGAIHVDTSSAAGQFTQADLELISAAAAHVAACVANAQLHQKVVASERLAAVGETVAGLTHCIGNIVQGIRGGTYAIDKALEKEDLDLLRKGWETVKRNNAFMEEMVYDLLSYSKKRTPELQTVDLNTLCAEACDLSRARAKAKDVTVNFEPHPEPISARLDAKSMRRCVLNLLVNAVDACAPNKGSVTLQTLPAAQDGMTRILVRDTGSGISEETQAKIFTMFFSTKGSKGTGLGLPVTKKIIEEHGGRLELQSKIGEGTTFTICLPRTET